MLGSSSITLPKRVESLVAQCFCKSTKNCSCSTSMWADVLSVESAATRNDILLIILNNFKKNTSTNTKSIHPFSSYAATVKYTRETYNITLLSGVKTFVKRSLYNEIFSAAYTECQNVNEFRGQYLSNITYMGRFQLTTELMRGGFWQ